MANKGKKVVTVNRKAKHDYAILESWEAGIVLKGAEVKSVREGKVNLRDGYGTVEGGELFLHNIHISPYDKSSDKDYNPRRKRKLLMHRSQINRVMGRVREKGLTIVPLEMYFTRGMAKLNIGLGKGRKSYDKREQLRRKTINREMERAREDQ